MKLHAHLVAAVISTLEEVLHGGKPADIAVSHALGSHPKWGSRDRRMFASQVYEIVRHWRWARHLAGERSEDCQPSLTSEGAGRPFSFPKVWAAWWMWNEQQELPEAFAHGLTLTEVQSRAEETVPLAIRESIPDWLDALGSGAHGDRWPALLHSLNQPADVFLRVNRLRASVSDVMERLEGEGISTELVDGVPDALRMTVRRPLQNSATFRAGWCEVQDAGSQLIARMLDVKPGMTVIDGCAGAGGKTLQLAALMRNEGRLVAMDVVNRKLDELESRARRNGVHIVETKLIREGTIGSLKQTADCLLLDAPCSGLGVLRRKPDTKWRLTEKELQWLIELQATILQDYSTMLKPGGTLVYATCSVLPQENEQQVSAFLKANPSWKLEMERHVMPDVEGWDGFYMATLKAP